MHSTVDINLLYFGKQDLNNIFAILAMLNAVILYLFIGFYNLNNVDSTEGKDYKGTQFIFSFMDNLGSPLLKIFITTDSPRITDVNVSTPKYNRHILHTFSLTKGQVKEITLPADIRGIGTELGNKGVQILSTAEVAVFAVNKHEYSTDACVIFPTDTLGRKYYVISWPGQSAFMIVATKDKTTVDITLVYAAIVYNGLTYTSGMTLSIYLEKWQTFHAYNETADFTGTYIKSNNDITVLSGNRCTKIGQGSCDHTVSQMTPVETFGHEFFATSMPNCDSPVSYRIISSEDNTNVKISGLPAIQLSTAGNVYTFEVKSKLSKAVSANKPIALTFFSHGNCDGINLGDPAMILMPPVPQFAAEYTFATIEVPDKPFRNFLTIVIRDIYITGLVLDGQCISSSNWRNVDGSAYFRVNDFSLNDGSHTVYHVDPTVTFLAVTTGLAKYNSYGYAAGQRLAPINNVHNCTATIATPGDIIDNDCDDLIDEEIQDGKDDDRDGRIDEDLAVLFDDAIMSCTTTQVTSTADVPETAFTIQTTLLIAGIIGLAAVVSCTIPSLLFIWKKKSFQIRVHSRPKPKYVDRARKPDMSWNRF